MRHSFLISEGEGGQFSLSTLFISHSSGQQYELLDWLNNITFPMEAKFSNIDLARRTYESVVRRVLDCGVRDFLVLKSSRC
jgi:cytosine/adenosine deaminase-related metal-dependent hydrolase